jgi:hypothetical protein
VTADRFGSPALDAALRTASRLLGMEVTLLGAVSGHEFVAERLHLAGDWPGVRAGLRVPVDDALCARLLSGARSSATTTDAQNDPDYAGSPVTAAFGIRSYVGVPVRDGSGRLLATLCGVDRAQVPVTDATVLVLQELAATVAAVLGDEPDALVVRRLPGGGWEVRDGAVVAGVTDDLTGAMALADLLGGELAPAGRPRRPGAPLDEVAQLRLAVEQLEHALAARVVVEQAIGVLSERQHHAPRESFERLRKVARSRGRKVHDLAREVVLSAQDAAVPLPPELAGRR